MIHTNLHVVATTSATHAANKYRGITALAHGAGKKNLKSKKMGA